MTTRIHCFFRGLTALQRDPGLTLKSYFGRLNLTLTQIQRVSVIARVAPATMLRTLGHAEARVMSQDSAPLLHAGAPGRPDRITVAMTRPARAL
jgi:hypothetical protein